MSVVETERLARKRPAAKPGHDPRQLPFEELSKQTRYTPVTSFGCENEVRFGYLDGKPICLKFPVSSSVDDKGRDFTQDPSEYVRKSVRLFDLLKAHNFRVPEIIHWDAPKTGRSYIACADLTENNEYVFVDSKRDFSTLISVSGQNVRGRDHLTGLKNWHEVQLILQAEGLRAAAYGFDFGVSPFTCVRTRNGVGEVWIHDVGECEYRPTGHTSRLNKIHQFFENQGKKLRVDPTVTRYLAAVTMVFFACSSLTTVGETRELAVFEKLKRKRPGITPKLFNFYLMVFQAIKDKRVPDTPAVWKLIESSRRIVFRDKADELTLTRDTLIEVRKIVDLPFRVREKNNESIELVLRLPWIEALSVLRQDPHKTLFDPSHIVGIAPPPRLAKQRGSFGYTYKSRRAERVSRGQIERVVDKWAAGLVWKRPHAREVWLQVVRNSDQRE